jgi:hypothetical protein
MAAQMGRKRTRIAASISLSSSAMRGMGCNVQASHGLASRFASLDRYRTFFAV